jgi:uncharacterized protein YegL
MKKILSIFTLAFIFIIMSQSSSFKAVAQSEIYLSIDRIDTTNFPQVDIYFSILDHQGFPIADLINDNISLSEDGQIVSDFQLTTLYQHPLEIVLVVDTSATMGYGDEPTPIQNLTVATKEFVNLLSSSDQVALVTFSNDANTVQDLTSDKNLIFSGLDGLEADGDSLLNDGIMEAILTLEGNALRPVIFLLIDGMDSGLSAYTLEEVTNQLIGHRIPIFIVSWRDANQDQLEKLTALVHGDLQFLPDYFPDENAFHAAFNNVSNSLSGARQQYKLSFSSGLPADGAEHAAVLAIDFLDKYVETTRQFSAEPGIVNVEILNLTDNQTVSGNVKVIPNVEAPAELERIDIALDGAALANVLTPPYEYTWDSSTVESGIHEITVIATDRASNKGQTSINLNVEKPISVQIVSPVNGDTISGPTSISADVTAHATVDRVEFFVDNASIGSVESEPYEIDWDLTNVTAGSHVIAVSAADENGFSAMDEVNIEVALTEGQPYWIILIVAMGAAAILIPVGLRSRRKRSAQQASTSTGGEILSQSLQPGQAILRELQGANPNQVWSLANDAVRLGRKRSTNDIPLMGLKASREQGLIQYEQGQYVIYSLKPENPILVNEIPVEKHALQSGDLIRGGESTFRFEIQGS